MGCSHIKVTGSSLGPWVFLMSKSIFVCVFEESLEEPPQLCFLQGQKLAKSKVIFFFFPLLKRSFANSPEKNVLTQMVLIFFLKTW